MSCPEGLSGLLRLDCPASVRMEGLIHFCCGHPLAVFENNHLPCRGFLGEGGILSPYPGLNLEI